ncbi:MAG: electron transport complex protein RnfB [Pseudohongiellaceae bacterium]
MEAPFVNTTAATYLMVSVTFLFGLYALAKTYNWIKNRSKQERLLVDKINQLLPQTQCGQCGYEGCRPYARAISQGEPVNQCPPGGIETIVKLTTLLNDQVKTLNPAHGEFEVLKVAVIREDECIGCTKCIKACPVDAILGGPKLMHTVIEAECTGCDLCVDPCPVDCIDMVPALTNIQPGWSLPDNLNSLHNSFGRQP